jgi:hypothetical protein
MKDDFTDLRRVIYTSPEEFHHVRQVLVNCIMATDIFDVEQIEKRSAKLNSYLQNDGESTASLKMTILLEHVIQASDVSHTMQHWFVYRKWNEKLYLEMHKAHVEGRFAVDPATFWYEGEIKFFDNYIIPLAEKLVKFGLLIHSNDELLAYARRNRNEWTERGRELVTAMQAQAILQHPFPMSTAWEH